MEIFTTMPVCFRRKNCGFTLIELSIVLVIIGLIAGGVLVGRDLVSASTVRAQITQIEKYQQAVNTFRAKYGYLPGDIPDPDATNFGFMARGQYAGEGDGNGQIEGNWGNLAIANGWYYLYGGETQMLWKDLSAVHLIESQFTAVVSSGAGRIPTTAGYQYFPPSPIGNGNFVYVISPFTTNYFSLSVFQGITNAAGQMQSAPGLSVQQAYRIDGKMDDGLPQYGNVVALYLTTNGTNVRLYWAGTSINGATTTLTPYNTATTGDSTTCFDNGGGSGKQTYSITQDNGNRMNCALMFKFQ